MKRALVISGGGAKGAFAGGIAQFLLEYATSPYNLFLGTSTGSLLVSHLALGRIDEIQQVFTHVNQKQIFDNNPFYIYERKGIKKIKIHHLNILKNFLRGKKTFGDSRALRRLIAKELPLTYFNALKSEGPEVVVSVSNLTLNRTEFKHLKNCSYDDFLDWIWISCNYVPFMSLTVKNKYEYADGGLGCVVAIEEAIRQGAKHIDAIVLTTEKQQSNRLRSRNAFDALTTTFEFMAEQIENQNVEIGRLKARENDCQLRLFFTPRVLTTNSLVFETKQMKSWWQEGYEFAAGQVDKDI